ncbi:MAG TPA: C25 family cysteine peptidase [Patescibacteria group bacterium]|nr:C25 family cysteine peptidase [Patescibacteria group bacterium]
MKKNLLSRRAFWRGILFTICIFGLSTMQFTHAASKSTFSIAKKKPQTISNLTTSTPEEVILLFPAANSEQATALKEEAKDWIQYRENQGYSFTTISLYELLNPADSTKDEITELQPEDIRLYIRDHFGNGKGERYLGLIGDIPEYNLTNNDYAQSDTLINFGTTPTFTIELFVKPLYSAENSFSEIIFSVGDLFFTSNNGFVRLNYAKGTNPSDWRQYAFGGIENEQKTFLDGNWHHLAYTFDLTNNTITAFSDGKIMGSIHTDTEASFTLSAALYGANTIRLVQGKELNNSVSYRYLPSMLDEVRVSTGLRYTTDFSEPILPLAADTSTIAVWNFDEDTIGSEMSTDHSNSAHLLTGYNGTVVQNSDLRLYGNYLYLPQQHELEANEYWGIPRYHLRAQVSDNVPSDIPYGLLEETTIPNGDPGGTIISDEVIDSITAQSTLRVFRIPIRFPGDLHTYLQRSINYEQASYKKNLALIAGDIFYAGDSTIIQCMNAHLVKSASSITTIFPTTIANCVTDFLVTDNNHRLLHYLTGTPTATGKLYQGGIMYNISHGSSTYIFATNDFLINFASQEVPKLNAEQLQVFISFACANDSMYDDDNARNLAISLYKKSGVISASASTTLYPESVKEVRIGEMQFLPEFVDKSVTIGEAMHTIQIRYFTSLQRTNINPSNTYLSNLLSINYYGDGLVNVNR